MNAKNKTIMIEKLNEELKKYNISFFRKDKRTSRTKIFYKNYEIEKEVLFSYGKVNFYYWDENYLACFYFNYDNGYNFLNNINLNKFECFEDRKRHWQRLGELTIEDVAEKIYSILLREDDLRVRIEADELDALIKNKTEVKKTVKRL